MGSGTVNGRYDYSPITSRRPGQWPHGKRLAVYVAVGVEEYRFGDGQTEDILPAMPAPDWANRSWRDYGNRVGAFRLFDRLSHFGIAPTVLLNTMVYDSAPAVMHAARAAGAEIVAHGISNSDALATVPDERAYLAAVSDRIEAEEGSRPLGWSSPWLSQTARTVDLLGELGYVYVLDLHLDDQPVWLKAAGGPILHIPYALELNDSSTIIGRQASASEFADMIIDEFDELVLAAREQPLVMPIVLHSFISGVPFRLKQISRALAHITAHTSEVWLTQPREIHAAWTTRHPEFGSP
jgi:peptidoglycan/xylan/chitin deacetylase (PgdA/CDA1 family)